MSDFSDSNSPLVAELADARERLAALESEHEALKEQLGSARDPEEALRRAHGEAIMSAIKKGRGDSGEGEA